MARAFNLNSHRPSHEIADVFPARRFTDTQLQSVEFTRPAESKYKFQKSSYFSGLLSKPKLLAIPPPATIEERSFRVPKSGGSAASKPLDMLFFTRKNAIAGDAKERSPQSPKNILSPKPIESSPVMSRLSHKKLSITSNKSLSSSKETLRLRVVELEKRLKNFEKTSRTYRAVDVSGDRLVRKPSAKHLSHQNSPIMAIIQHSSLKKSPRMVIDEHSIAEKLSRGGRDHTAYSNSRREDSRGQLGTQSHTESELNKLKDRIISVMNRDQKLVKVLERSGF